MDFMHTYALPAGIAMHLDLMTTITLHPSVCIRICVLIQHTCILSCIKQDVSHGRKEHMTGQRCHCAKPAGIDAVCR